MMREINLDSPLDPDAMWARMRLARMQGNAEAASRAAWDLRGWILHNSPPPTGMLSTNVLIACRDVLDWADSLTLGPATEAKGLTGNPILDCGR
jgi:hypothetical protein